MPSPIAAHTGSSATPTRSSFALVGPSVTLDPQHYAVRRDLADIRLADRVFAPHYALAVSRMVAHAVAIRSSRDATGVPLGTAQAGEIFEVLEFSAGLAWGMAPAQRLVGYVDTSALSRFAP